MNFAVSISDHWLIVPTFVSPFVIQPMPGFPPTSSWPGVNQRIDIVYVPVRDP